MSILSSVINLPVHWIEVVQARKEWRCKVNLMALFIETTLGNIKLAFLWSSILTREITHCYYGIHTKFSIIVIMYAYTISRLYFGLVYFSLRTLIVWTAMHQCCTTVSGQRPKMRRINITLGQELDLRSVFSW